MANYILYHIADKMPNWIVEKLRTSTAARRFVRGLTQGRTQPIPYGVGAGLLFNAGTSNPAYALGTNELPVQTFLAQSLNAGNTFYDIGGNVGFFTVIGAHLVEPTGHVYVFEPVPSNAAIIRRNIALNEFNHVTVFEKAVAQVSGHEALNVAEYSGGAMLASAGKPPDHTDTITVESVSIDDLLAQNQLMPPTVVKIDVEGAELTVFRGMLQTLLTYKPVLIYEIDDSTEAAYRAKCETCEQFLNAVGYQLVSLQNSYEIPDWIVGHFVATPGH